MRSIISGKIFFIPVEFDARSKYIADPTTVAATVSFHMKYNLEKFRAITKLSGKPIISLDIGTKKTGIAFTDAAQTMAWPLGSMVCKLDDEKLFVKKLKTILEQNKLQNTAGLVIGIPLPIELSKKSIHGNRVHALVDRLVALDPIFFKHVCYIDERFSTATALKISKNSGVKIQHNFIDALAACEILWRYIDASNR